MFFYEENSRFYLADFILFLISEKRSVKLSSMEIIGFHPVIFIIFSGDPTSMGMSTGLSRAGLIRMSIGLFVDLIMILTRSRMVRAFPEQMLYMFPVFPLAASSIIPL
jgi:hypothetical protein